MGGNKRVWGKVFDVVKGRRIRRTFSSGVSRLDVVVTLTIWTSKLPLKDDVQPGGGEAVGEMADVTASGLGLARAETARASRANEVFMICFDGWKFEECG